MNKVKCCVAIEYRQMECTNCVKGFMMSSWDMKQSHNEAECPHVIE